jgi:hypothetical protein
MSRVMLLARFGKTITPLMTLVFPFIIAKLIARPRSRALGVSTHCISEKGHCSILSTNTLTQKKPWYSGTSI